MSASRIIHIPRRFVAEEWGGTETVILEIARKQMQAGANVSIETSMALAKSKLEKIGGVPVRRHRYCYPFFGLTDANRAAMDKKGGNLLSVSLFRALVGAKDVRIFHAHALKRVGGTVRTAARIQRKPYVVSLHGGVFDVPAAELEQMSEPTKGKLEWGRSFGALLGSRRVLEDADHVICVGQSEWEEARKKLCHDRVSYLPNGVDAARFSRGDRMKFRARYAIRQHDHVVLNVSRIDAQKNQVLLVEAFARFRAEKPNSILVLIGPETSPAYARSIRQKIDDLGLATCVRMLPGFPAGSSELVDAYHAADVFVLPSRHEPFGIVVLEAWSAGKPVIVSDIGGLKALVQDGVTGLKFDSSANDAAEQLAGKIKVLADDSVLRRTIAQNGMSSARTNYDWSRIHQQLETIYQKAEAFAQRSK